VIYPLESETETKLEAAGFSVDSVPGITREAECVAFGDEHARSRGMQSPVSSLSIRSRLFRHASAIKKSPGHLQTADFYRIFAEQKCYELQIAVSISDDPVLQKVSTSNSLPDARANSARESLKLILSSVTFAKE
jgi:hypothetical protein